MIIDAVRYSESHPTWRYPIPFTYSTMVLHLSEMAFFFSVVFIASTAFQAMVPSPLNLLSRVLLSVAH